MDENDPKVDHRYPMRKLARRYLRRYFGDRVQFGETDYGMTISARLDDRPEAVRLTRAFRPERDGWSGGIEIARPRLREVAAEWATHPHPPAARMSA